MKTGGVGGIDSSRIEAMIAQLKAAATRPQAGVPAISMPAIKATDAAAAVAPKADFSDALQTALNSVNATQQKSEELGKRFALGDDKVNLSDVMIATQKASITFQASLQVRNKLVSAYHEIMNMQV